MRSGRCFATSASAFSPVIGLDQFVARRQQIAEDLHVVLLVLDQENALAHDGLAGSTAVGIVKVKIAPLPGLESTQ